MIRIKLPTHKHPLYPSPWVSKCDLCPAGVLGGYRRNGYRCYECKSHFHKDCAESPLEINHPSHPQHLLSLTNDRSKGRKCKLCGATFYPNHMFYHCPQCDFVVDTACAINPPPDDVILNPGGHEHSLVIMKNAYVDACDFCGERYGFRYLYRCSQCCLKFHLECSKLPLEINYPCHPKHPLKYLKRREQHFSDGKCRICAKELTRKFYDCSICKFSVDVGCVRDPPPLSILFPKAHEHQLSLIPRIISFNCDACGMSGDRSPYSCLQCDFMIHQSCIDLPEIINVNRHEHRLSRRPHLSPGRTWVCGFCHKNVDWSYGAYSCSVCPDFAIHSNCAIRDDVWDKLELKGIPEEIEEIEPFKVVHGNHICHFSHAEHYLQLNEKNIISGGSTRCEACVFPIYSQPFYSCVQCSFILHKTCANLPRKKRHVYHDKPLTLICGGMTGFECSKCENRCVGFRYTDFHGFHLDVTCGALSGSIIHESHPCRLYYVYGCYWTCVPCVACSNLDYRIFSCYDCKFALDLSCVALPKTTEHWYDQHPLSLCYEKKTSGECWCDICEKQMDPAMTWFYACDTCCATFHTKCVLGDFFRLMPGRIITYGKRTKWRFEVMHNTPAFLPRCYVCRLRRAVPFVLYVFFRKKNIFICSFGCLFRTSLRQDLF